MSAKRTETTTATKMTLADCPAYVQAKSRHDFLRTQQATVQVELMGRLDRQRSVSAIDDAAQKMLAAADPDALVRLDDLPAETVESTREVEGRLKVIDRAVELAQHAHELEWKLASGAVIEARRDEHVAIVNEIAEHLEALCDAVCREQAWVDALRQEGLYFAAGLGKTFNPQSKEFAPLFAALRRTDARAFKRRLKAHGY